MQSPSIRGSWHGTLGLHPPHRLLSAKRLQGTASAGKPAGMPLAAINAPRDVQWAVSRGCLVPVARGRGGVQARGRRARFRPEHGCPAGGFACDALRRHPPGASGRVGVDPGDIPAAGGRPACRLHCCFTNIPTPDANPAELANGLGPRTAAGIARLAHGRCGQGEAVHSVLKSDLAAGILPSGMLGANAACLKAAAVTLNVVALLRTVSMGGGWLRTRMKRIRAVWIHHVGMVSRRGRRTTVALPPAARHVSLALDRPARSQAPP